MVLAPVWLVHQFHKYPNRQFTIKSNAVGVFYLVNTVPCCCCRAIWLGSADEKAEASRQALCQQRAGEHQATCGSHTINSFIYNVTKSLVGQLRHCPFLFHHHWYRQCGVCWSGCHFYSQSFRPQKVPLKSTSCSLRIIYCLSVGILFYCYYIFQYYCYV